MQRTELIPSEMPHGAYSLLNSCVVPRPIAWVSTTSADGVDNLAPHSYFTVVSVHPPMVQITSVGEKDTLRNARETGEMVVNVCTESLAVEVNATATHFTSETSEYDEVGLEREPSSLVRPPRVARSPIALECRVHDIRPMGDCWLITGEVVCLAISSELYRDGSVDTLELAPISRLGRSDFGTVGRVFSMRRIPLDEWEAGVR